MHRRTLKYSSVIPVNYLLELLSVQKKPIEDYFFIPILQIKKTDFSKHQYPQTLPLKNNKDLKIPEELMEDMDKVKKATYEQNANINKKIENLKRNQKEILELKITITVTPYFLFYIIFYVILVKVV